MTRREDIVTRYGGEEFMIILPETKEEGAKLCAERIRDKIKNTPQVFDDKKILITVSIGVVTYSGLHPFESYEKLIDAADRCLYYSKQHGRNRTTCFSLLKD
jgi:diguanylate cyclase (GGDEF)-like protein